MPSNGPVESADDERHPPDQAARPNGRAYGTENRYESSAAMGPAAAAATAAEGPAA